MVKIGDAAVEDIEEVVERGGVGLNAGCSLDVSIVARRTSIRFEVYDRLIREVGFRKLTKVFTGERARGMQGFTS